MSKKEIITFNGENGKSLDFELIAEVGYLEYNYLILKPVDEFEGMDSDMAMVFRVENTPDGDTYVIEEDDEIINAIEEIYNEEVE